MPITMGLLRNEHGVYCVRKKVPKQLEQAVAQVLGGRKERQTFLKRSLGTKQLQEAKRKAPAVLIEFDSVLSRARAVAEGRPVQVRLSQSQIDQLAEHFYAKMLGDDERWRFGGKAYMKEVDNWVRRHHPKEELDPPFFPLESLPEHGLSKEQLERRAEHLVDEITITRECLALGDFSLITDELDVLLADLNLDPDRNSPEYRQLGTEALRQCLRALEAIRQRNEGEAIPTPKPPEIGGHKTPAAGEALSAAFAGWQKDRRPASKTLAEYQRAITLFTALHGDLPVGSIKRKHALAFREALQDVPRTRPAKMAQTALPELVEWGRAHPELPRLAEGTINKLIGGVQAVSLWGYDHGLVPDDMHWSDPFARMRLEEDEPGRDTFTPAELQTIFTSPAFIRGDRPKAGKGDASYWLPLLGLFTGARRGELAGLTVANLQSVGPGDQMVLMFEKDRTRGKALKTKRSARTVPVHPELTRLGFRQYVETVHQSSGPDAWLFPEIAPQSKHGATDWSKWFSGYLRTLGITDRNKVFHTFRHGFIDALRAAGVDDEVKRALVGHSGRGSAHDAYGAKDMLRRFGWVQLSQAVANVSYPGLDLSHLHRAV